MSKRVLIVTGIFPPDIGGPASYAKTLATHLVAQGDTVTIVTYSSQYSIADKVPFRVIRVWRRWPWLVRHLIYSIRVFVAAARTDGLYTLSIINGGMVSIVSAWIWKKKVLVRVPGDYAWQAAVEKGKTSLMIDDFQKVPKRGWIGLLARIQSVVCRRADGVIVPSRYLAQLVQGWGIKPDHIHAIYNGADFQPSPLSKEEARKAIGIPGTLIVSCGRLAPWKGFRMLIKVMPQLLQVNQFFRLVIVGDGSDLALLQSIVRNLGLERKVFLVGRKTREELAVYLAAADLFVLNTGYEGFSHQVLEAMKAGVPVVTTTVGGNRELISQGENGILIRYNDEFNLVEAIKAVWRQPELREHLIDNARESVTLFSVERMLTQTEELLTLSFR